MKNLKFNKTGADFFPTTPFTPESKPISLQKTRRSSKTIDATIDIAKDLSTINKKLNQITKNVHLQNDLLQERINELESEISGCRETIMLLSTRMDAIHSMYARLEIENNADNILNDESTAVLTVDTTIEYLKSQPIFINAFLKDNFDDQLLDMILNLDKDVRSVFIEYSLYQLDRITKCFEACFELQKNIESDIFIELLSIYLTTIFISNNVYIFQLDSKTGNYFCNFKSKHLILSLKESDSLISSAIESQTIAFYSNPSTEVNFSLSLDPLFNPENKPILIVPVSTEATFLIVHADESKFTFNNEDVSIAKLFESLIEPLFHYHNRYVELNKREKFCHFLTQFQKNLSKKYNFDSLLQFLSKSLNEFVNSDEVRIFVLNSGNFFTTYRLSEGRLVESKCDFTGIPSFAVKHKFHISTNFLSKENVSCFSEEIDGWAAEKPFSAIPIFKNKEKVSAVLCLTGKNKFSSADFECLMSIAPLLALVIPRCVEASKTLSAEECQKTLSQYPTLVRKITFDILSKERSIFILLGEIQKGTKSEIISAYVTNDGSEFEHLMTVNDGKIVDTDLIDSEFVKFVFDSEKPINESGPSRLPHGPECQSIIAVSNKENKSKKIVIICLNSKSSTGRFDEGYHSYIASFSSLIVYAIEIQSRNKGYLRQKESVTILETAFSDCEEALKTADPLMTLIESIVRRIQMANFMLLRYKPLNRGYECILASEQCKRATISEENQFIKIIESLAKPSEIEKNSINSNNSLFELMPTFSHMVADPIDSGMFLICTGNKVNKKFDLYFNAYSPLVKSLYRNHLLSSQKVVASTAEISKIDISSNTFIESDLSSRLFSVLKLTEPQKIEVILKMFTSFDLLTIMETNAEEMTRFLLIVRDKYHKVPYHNWDHAVDAIQFTYSSIQRGRMRKFLRPHHTIAILLASLLHDIDHKGYNTSYHNKAKSPLYYTYGAESTLEKHHLSIATKILLESLITKKKMLYKDAIFWSIFSSAILSTDMTKLFDYIEKFREIQNNFNSSSEDHLLLLAQLIINCSNVGNCTRPFDVAFSMAKKLQEEYAIQAEREKVLKIQGNENVLMMSGDLGELEINFYNAVALPLLKILGTVIPELSDFIIQSEDNKKQWNEYSIMNKSKK